MKPDDFSIKMFLKIQCVFPNAFFLEGFALIRARAGPKRAHMGHMARNIPTNT